MTAPETGSIWRSSLFAAGQVGFTVVYALLSLLTYPLPYGARYRFITSWSRLNLWWLKLTCGLSYQVEGLENLPARPAIVLAKHQSTLETLIFQGIFPPQTWLLKRELLRIPFFGWGLALLEPIAIDRSAGRAALRQFLETGQERLEAGRWVIVFPEGTRVPPGQTGRYAAGGAALAAHSGCPVLPVAHNAGLYWPRHGFIKRPGTVRVVIGPVIETAGLSAADINRRARDWIERTARALL
ncbi:MAG TPA: 1-acyl-sn-glycerol-3-phosphate acyltransferase, partial [Gammaproteobacteria bacterium]|nr:1-acyl-sn-glycerol-3-phosphate acyltransferase [Gammaproteobacteria bacterium]